MRCFRSQFFQFHKLMVRIRVRTLETTEVGHRMKNKMHIFNGQRYTGILWLIFTCTTEYYR